MYKTRYSFKTENQFPLMKQSKQKHMFSKRNISFSVSWFIQICKSKHYQITGS